MNETTNERQYKKKRHKWQPITQHIIKQTTIHIIEVKIKQGIITHYSGTNNNCIIMYTEAY